MNSSVFVLHTTTLILAAHGAMRTEERGRTR